MCEIRLHAPCCPDNAYRKGYPLVPFIAIRHVPPTGWHIQCGDLRKGGTYAQRDTTVYIHAKYGVDMKTIYPFHQVESRLDRFRKLEIERDHHLSSKHNFEQFGVQAGQCYDSRGGRYVFVDDMLGILATQSAQLQSEINEPHPLLLEQALRRPDVDA